MQAIKLGQLCHVKGRIGFRGYKKSDLVKAGEGAIVIGGKNISTNTLNLSNPDYISWKKYYESPEIMVNTGDIIIAQRGTIGKMGFVKNEIGQATINPSLVLLKDITCDNAFLFYYLLSLQDYIISQATQTVIPMITQKQIENLTVQLPDIDTQKAIASTLQSIDDKISINNKIVETSEKLMREIYDYWFVQFDFPDENGRPYKSSGGEMIYDETLKREIPKGWKVVNIEDLAQLTWGQCPDGVNILDKGSEVPSLPYCSGAGDMDGGYIVNCQARTDNSRREAESGTILLSIAGTIGKMAIANEKISLGRATLGIAPNDKKYYALVWLLLKMYNSRLKTASVGAVQKIINKSNMRELNIAIPDITDIDYGALNSTMEIIKSLSLENSKLASLRDWLLPMLMNGQIKVNG